MRTILAALTVLAAVPAGAQEMQATVIRRSNVPDGKNEISAQMGGQASLGGTTPAGLRLQFDYSRRLTDLVWLNFKLNPIFGVGSTRATCVDRFGQPYECGGFYAGLDSQGHALEAMAGVKLKFAVPKVPELMPFCNINAGVVGVFARPRNDEGAGFVFNTGGGIRYFVHKNVALGGELTFTLGPAWYSETCNGCNNGRTEFYRAISFATGAEFLM